MTLLKDTKEGVDETINPFAREPSQKFKETFGERRLLDVILSQFCKGAKGFVHHKKLFLKFFKSKEDASLVWDELLEPLGGNGWEEPYERCSKVLERPRNKWGDSPLEKALGNIKLTSFLSVKSKI